MLCQQAETGRCIQSFDQDALGPMHQVIQMIPILQVDAILLGLTAAAQVDHQYAGHLECKFLSVPEADQVDGQINAGSDAGTREDMAGLREQNPFLDIDPRIPLL